MTTVIIGLGNTGSEYAKTRHNAGRMAVELLAREECFDAFSLQKSALSLICKGEIAGNKVLIALPETMMNLSGKAVATLVKSKKAAQRLIVVHDDLDLPLGTIKMVYARGAGGHKGVESIMRAIKTKEFARIRIGISGKGKKNQAKKVSGEEKVIKHVIGKFKSAEDAVLKKALKKASETARLFVAEGVEVATMFANTK